MGNDSAKLIEAWFAEHSEDGEFVCGAGRAPYSVIGPPSSVARMIFTTKPTIVSMAIESRELPAQFGMVGRYGLPSDADVGWVCDVIGPRALLFLGDMDPVDLMVFAWLRARVHPRRITYLGVSDDFIDALGISSTESLSAPCAPSEQKSLAFLTSVFPDFRETVGCKCARVLTQGQKVELDAVVSAEERTEPILRCAIRTEES
jgi:hypothetical protein